MKIVPVLWAMDETLLGLKGYKPKKGDRFWIGVCGHSKRIFRVARSNNPQVYMVTDIIIDSDICEEQARCLDFRCPLNHTSWQSLAVDGQVGRYAKEPDNFGKPRPGFWEETFEELLEKHPHGGVMK